MTTAPRFRMHLALALAAMLLATSLWAEDEPALIRLKLKDVAGRDLAVPDAEEPTVLLFARTDQEQSRSVIKNLRAEAKDLPKLRVIVVLSGKEQSVENQKKFASDMPWPVVLDGDYALVGQLRVRVWPTSIVVSTKGVEVARLTGASHSYARDLSAHLDYASGKIDLKTRDKRLGIDAIVGDSSKQMAARHLRVAQRLLEKGMTDQAMAEIDKGLALQPKDVRLLLTKARTLLLLGKANQALDALDALDATSELGARIRTIRGGALVALGQWDNAIKVLEEAAKLNPDPAETLYFLGLAYAQKGRWKEASEAFRKAFEATPQGRAAIIKPGGASEGKTVIPPSK